MLAVIFLTAPFSAAKNRETASADRIDVYYFHSDFRCPTCHKIEQYTRSAVENGFKDEIAAGKLEYMIINVEEPGNEHYVKDYGLYTKSVVLSLVRNGKEVKYENLEKVWEYVGDEKRFTSYVDSKVKDFLKNI